MRSPDYFAYGQTQASLAVGRKDERLVFSLIEKDTDKQLARSFTIKSDEIPDDCILIEVHNKEFVSLLQKLGIIALDPLGGGIAGNPIKGIVQFEAYTLNPVAVESLMAKIMVDTLIQKITGIRPPDDE
jgi:hypothetical protein